MRFNRANAFALSAALVAGGTHSLSAQDAALAIGPTATTADVSTPSTSRALAGALLGGAGGMLLGGVAGLYTGDRRCADGLTGSCGAFYGMLFGAGVGLTVGIPVGAHLLNRRQGALPYSLLASAALAAAGAVAFKAADGTNPTHRDRVQGAVLYSVPILQIVTATFIETRSRRR